MNNRIKEVRKALGLSGADFGSRIGLKPAAICDIEKGRNTPTEQTILSICREYNVNAEWLRTGAGEMFKDLTSEEETKKIIESLADNTQANKLKKIIIKHFADLPDDVIINLSEELAQALTPEE